MKTAPLKEPFERFAEVFAKAKQAQPKDPNAMVVASVDDRGRPSSRVVLLKDFDEKGFVFYTNHKSRKGRELKRQRVAALCFYWPALDMQVRIEGDVSTVSDAEADSYFATRPRISQLGAWASLQSETLDARATLEQRLADLSAKYPEGSTVPRPPHWSGFRVAPNRIEFWVAGEFRLHDRTVYERRNDEWAVSKLYP